MGSVPHLIRPMTAADVADVARLEQIAGDVRWSEAQIRAELDKAISRYYVAAAVQSPRSKAKIGIPDFGPWTLDLGPWTVVGYVGGWVIPPELQIANIVIHPEFRCQGLGRRLLDTLLERAKAEGCTYSTLEVRRNNAHAQALYRAVGYHGTGTRPKAYQHPEEDAILMERKWA